MDMIRTRRFTGIVKSKFTMLLFGALFLSPAFSTAQSFEEEGVDYGQPVEQSPSGERNGIWGTQEAEPSSTPIGVPGTGSTSAADNGAVGSTRGSGAATSGTPGASLRPSAGPTVDATGGPGGNPDVPFDTNMNIMFLIAGVVFAFIVYKKHFKLKPVAVEKK